MSTTDIAGCVNTTGLEPEERRVLGRLVAQWQQHLPGNQLRLLYYNGKQTLRAAGKLGLAMPPQLEKLETVLGWPAKAVTTLEQRLDVMGFVPRDGRAADYGLDEIAAANQFEELQSMTHTAALIHGTAFVTVSAGDAAAGEPPALVSARSAMEATALYSRRSRQIVAGLTINGDDAGEPLQVVLWLPDRVVTLERGETGWQLSRMPHGLGRVPMERLAFRPHLEREFGTPRITDEVMGLTDAAVRTVLRMEGTAEFFSFPQRWIVGAEAEDFADSVKTYLNRLLVFGRDEEGQVPELGQFSPSSPQPHIDQLRALAGVFSGATSIPLNYLGIVHDNPSSADAIRAAEADLVTVAERAQRNFGASWARVMALAAEVADGGPVDGLEGLLCRWRDASTPTRAAQAQSVMSLVSTGVLPAQSAVTWELLGYDESTIRRLEADRAREQGAKAWKQTQVDAAEDEAAGSSAEVDTRWG